MIHSNPNLVEQQEYIENSSEELDDTYFTKQPPQTVKELKVFHTLDSFSDNSEYIDLESFDNISQYINLEFLSLTHCSGLTDISPIKNLRKLKVFASHGNYHIKDFSPLGNLVSLHKLSLDEETIKDISFVSNLANLKILQLSHLEISDISCLAQLNNLEELYLMENKIQDISVLANLTSLKVLNLESNNILDITPLTKLKNLSLLKLDKNPIKNWGSW